MFRVKDEVGNVVRKNALGTTIISVRKIIRKFLQRLTLKRSLYYVYIKFIEE